ncbi:MAG: non-ribosomal peptide synthetase [Acidobacteria bacterium]|nr:MAG: non-ribosomal peptide synthetase [Acidobacteriota bacterium]
MPRTFVETANLESQTFNLPDQLTSAELHGDCHPQFPQRPTTLLFEEQVARNPTATAIVCENDQLTFAELNARANQLARHLRNLGVGRESLVGLCIDRSVEMAVGILGILKAGAAYLPIDPEYPQERIAFMLEDAQPAVVLTKAGLQIGLLENARAVFFDQDEEAIAANSIADLKEKPEPKDLAYVIYTSGSTGKPKGVMIEHRNLSNYVLALNHEVRIDPTDRYLHTASIAFSSARRQLLLPLSQGAAVVIATSDQRKDPIALFQMIKTRGVSVMDAVPSFWRNCTAILSGLPEEERRALLDNGLRVMLSASEPLPSEVVRTWMNGFNHPARHVHMFGQTETAGIVSLFPIPRDFDGEVYIPIGGPIANTDIYILDEDKQPCAIDEAGELYIGGAGVGRGYLNRPEVTAEKFIELDGQRLYRTGDWARVRAHGRIEFAGRRDQQIKLRGFRIEVGEVEGALSEHLSIRECAVVAREIYGDTKLIGYYVSKNAETTANDLREFLSARLPEYAVPSFFVALEALPLSANGKLNRLALPMPELARANVASEFSAPQDQLEDRLASIWRDVLRVEQIGRNDNFFELGGHSLLAAQISARMRREFRIEAPISSLFEYPTVALLAQFVRAGELEELVARSIQPFDRNGAAPLSFNQQQFWLLDQSSPNRSAYNVRTALKITGPLSVEKLQRAIDTVVARHEILRTNIVTTNGSAVQVISSSMPVPLSIADVSSRTESQRENEVERALAEEGTRPFDLGSGALIRARLLKLDIREHVLLVTLHHIVCDGWSINVLWRELTSLYHNYERRSSLPQLSIQYADFALWQRRWLQDDTIDRQLNYWKQQLADAPTALDLPTDFPRPSLRSYEGRRISLVLPAELTDAIRRLSRNENATVFMTLLAAFQTLLFRYSGQEDVVVGTPVAGRSMIETEDLIGAFVNTLVLRGDLNGNPSFREFLVRVRQTVLGAFCHQELPFEKLVEELNPERKANRSPLFQVMFSFENMPEPELTVNGTKFSTIDIESEAAKFDLSLDVSEDASGISISFEYATDLFAPETIERLLAHYQNLLKAIVAEPAASVADLSMLEEHERNLLLVEWNSNRIDVPQNAGIHQLFEAQAAKNPEALAAEFNGEQLTYGELNARANQVAHYLQKQGVEPEALVGISVERSLDMLIAVFGVLKSGGGYVPLDPNYPRDRIAFMVDDAKLALLITQQHLVKEIPVGGAQVLCIDSDWEMISRESDANSTTNVDPENVAFVIYTSGSTGNPKGVAIEHRSLVHFTRAANQVYEITPNDRMLQFASLSFDMSAEEIYVSLTNGAALVLRTDDMISSPQDFAQFCEEERVSILDLPTAYWHELTGALADDNLKMPESARLVIIGGEKASADRFAAWHKSVGERIRLINTYGPTETTIACTMWDMNSREGNRSGAVPIGRPVANTPVYVLDKTLRPVPIGVAGELHVGGPGVTRGYLNQPDLTVERFIRNPFSDDPDERLYRTGDIVSYRANGILDFLGRADNQIKIRGFRVELEEIEQALRSHESVNECVVVLREDHDKRLVAYVVAEEGLQPSASELRNLLRGKLPSYMVPALFEIIEGLPLMPNGKINRAALPAPQSQPEADETFVAPATPLEELLASTWRQVLNLERIGAHDDFFDLGGHSLLAAKVVSLVRNDLDVQFTMVDVFQAPTIASLAELLYPRVAEKESQNELAKLLEEIACMSEEEAQQHLQAELVTEQAAA